MENQEQIEKTREEVREMLSRGFKKGKPIIRENDPKDEEKQLTPVPPNGDFALPEESNKVGIGVKFNLKTHQVILTIGSKMIAFSIADARGLALALRQNANFVERHSN